MEQEKKDGGEELLTRSGSVSHCHAGWNTILMLCGVCTRSYLKIPIWDRSFGSCSDWPTGFLAAVLTPDCFEASFHLLLPSTHCPSSAAWPGWWPRDPITVQHCNKTEGQVSPNCLSRVFLQWYPPLHELLTRCLLALSSHHWDQFTDL